MDILFFLRGRHATHADECDCPSCEADIIAHYFGEPLDSLEPAAQKEPHRAAPGKPRIEEPRQYAMTAKVTKG